MEALYQLSYSPRALQGTSELLCASASEYAPVRSLLMTETEGTTDAPRFRYNARLANEIEAKWQERWERDRVFWAPNPSGPLSEGFDEVADRRKLYVLDMFPYPSGEGLHVDIPSDTSGPTCTRASCA